MGFSNRKVIIQPLFERVYVSFQVEVLATLSDRCADRSDCDCRIYEGLSAKLGWCWIWRFLALLRKVWLGRMLLSEGIARKHCWLADFPLSWPGMEKHLKDFSRVLAQQSLRCEMFIGCVQAVSQQYRDQKTSFSCWLHGLCNIYTIYPWLCMRKYMNIYNIIYRASAHIHAHMHAFMVVHITGNMHAHEIHPIHHWLVLVTWSIIICHLWAIYQQSFSHHEIIMTHYEPSMNYH